MKNESTPPAQLRSGIDIGGTFTDLIMLDCTTGEFVIGKSLTTPHDPSEAIESVLTAASTRLGRPLSQLDDIVHGTTLVTNALIERKGDRTALLTTRGFRDSIEIGRESRYDLYDILIDKPQPLVPRYLRFDVPERTLADGSILEPLDVAYVEQLTRELAESGIVAIAVTFINSFANPAHEQSAREAILR